MRDYSGLIASVNNAMIEKLMENEHKPGFDDILFGYAVRRTREEHQELETAFNEFTDAEYDYLEHESPENKAVLLIKLKEMRREAADSANFPAFIIYKCDKLIAALEAGE